MSDRDPVSVERYAVRAWRRRARMEDGLPNKVQIRDVGDEVKRDSNLKVAIKGLGGDAFLFL